MEQTAYGFGQTVRLPYEQAVERTKEALKAEGFGILSEIDVRKTMKEKLNVDFRPYVILGACNPPLAHKALEAEADIGLLLPCNVVVREEADGQSRVMAMDPEAAMGIVHSAALEEVASEAKSRLQRAMVAIVG
ncbi:MAG TPA: DUF302 domain-containing protein [Chloroflexota bacterium]|jgi:uncharacterized protein (DUF302 family)